MVGIYVVGEAIEETTQIGPDARFADVLRVDMYKAVSMRMNTTC